jgi:membrane protein insertase Oxa1/YidC/SpoIIIJ
MSELLYTLFVEPLMLIYAFAFEWLSDWFEPGLQLIFFSLLLNLFLLPIYRQMERRNRGRLAIKQKVAQDVARMKKHFRGRERYFYIRAVYRQYGYHPISELLGSADLFVQIVVFVTVFHFLSGFPALSGQSFGPIADLSKPDGLLFGINLLPLLMTAVNAGAVFAYTETPSRRIQALALAGIFLVLLYGSASGLVLYWTANNLFSLVRNVIERFVVARLPQWITRPAGELAGQR